MIEYSEKAKSLCKLYLWVLRSPRNLLIWGDVYDGLRLRSFEVFREW
ncbi:hypothetical protein [Nostoc sp.]